MYSKGKYLLLQTLVMLLSPITSFFMSVRFYKNAISQIFFVIFAFYFGMHFYMGWDLSMHYSGMRLHYCGKSLQEILSNPAALGNGLDFYHITIKYIISRFTISKELFAGIISAIYSMMFLFFFNQFRRFYKGFLPVSCGILLLCIVCVVEFYWYQGVRFWLGAYCFAGFYLKYLNTEKRRYLLFSVSCIFFHYTLVNLFWIFILNWLLSKVWVWGRVFLFAASWVYRTLSIDFMGWVIKNVPGLDLGIRTSSYHHVGMQLRIQKMRSENNVFYAYRSEILIVFGLLILMIMWSRRVQFSKKYLQMFFFAFTIYTVVNFAFAELIFFDRFLKLAVLLFYSFLFITAYQNYEKIKGVSLIIMVLAVIPMTFELLTAVVEMREHLFFKELWFGNFFIDWSGGISDAHGKW